MDNQTERSVMEAIEALQGYKTHNIIANHMTTIKQCDKVYVVVDGKIEQCKKDEILGEE